MKKALMLIVILSIFISCKKDNPTIPVSKPTISFISPSVALVGDDISVIGTNFGSERGSNSVFINNINVTQYLTWSDTLIKIIVPVGASTGKLFLMNNDLKSNEVDFTLGETINYETIIIGNQIWMLENLDVDHYRNGDSIPEVKDKDQWSKLTTGAWCYYNNDSAKGETIGVHFRKLYNWFAVNNVRGLAPKGWHVPTDVEWSKLVTYLGGDSIAGSKLKVSGLYPWSTPNTGDINSSGFSALPGSSRDSQGYFGNIDYGGSIGVGGFWWSSTENTMSTAFYWTLKYEYAGISRVFLSKACGFSVRCVKD